MILHIHIFKFCDEMCTRQLNYHNIKKAQWNFYVITLYTVILINVVL